MESRAVKWWGWGWEDRCAPRPGRARDAAAGAPARRLAAAARGLARPDAAAERLAPAPVGWAGPAQAGDALLHRVRWTARRPRGRQAHVRALRRRVL